MVSKAHIIRLPTGRLILFMFSHCEFSDGPLSSLGKYAADLEPTTNFTALSKHDNNKDNRTEDQ